MRIALVSYMRRDQGQIPLGLLGLAQIAKDEGSSDIKVLDLPAREEEAEFFNALADRDFVGFSSICSTYNQTIRLANRLRECGRSTIIALGGPHASHTAFDSLNAFGAIDLVFLNEAENSWRQFIRASVERKEFLFWQSISGIVWRNGESLEKNGPADLIDDLADIPFPALELYRFEGRTSVTPIEIGRGCPFACTFCSSSPFFKRRFRLKPVKRILAEMDGLHESYGSRTFYFVQDSFSNNHQFVKELCAALKCRKDYEWYCSARTDQVTEDLVAMLGNAKCKGIYFGLETGSNRMQRLINKNLDVSKALETIGFTAKRGLQVTTSMIAGFPEETREDLADTLRAFLRLKSEGHELVQLHSLAPLPGSALFAERHELEFDGMDSDFSDNSSLLDNEDCSLIERFPTIFGSFWHFKNNEVERARILFVTEFLTLASTYAQLKLRLISQYMPEELIKRLMGGEIPSPWCERPKENDDTTNGAKLWGEGKIYQNTLERRCARRVAAKLFVEKLCDGLIVDRMRRLAYEVCGKCGACCTGCGGVLCGNDEWPSIRDTFAAKGYYPAVRKIDSSALLKISEFGLLVSGESPSFEKLLGSNKPDGKRVCPALIHKDGEWRCSIDDIKPSGCLAFPLKLILRKKTNGPDVVSCELERVSLDRCELDKALRSNPGLLDLYVEMLKIKLASREGAFALANYNAARWLEAQKVENLP